MESIVLDVYNIALNYYIGAKFTSFGIRERKKQESGENCMKMSFMIFAVRKILSDRIKKHAY
jgi:hypothetical protein